MNLLPKSFINTIYGITTDQEYVDLLLSRYYNLESRKEAKAALDACYEDLRKTTDQHKNTIISLHRLRIEDHIEYLERESVSIGNRINKRMHLIPGATKRVITKLDEAYSKIVPE